MCNKYLVLLGNKILLLIRSGNCWGARDDGWFWFASGSSNLLAPTFSGVADLLTLPRTTCYPKMTQKKERTGSFSRGNEYDYLWRISWSLATRCGVHTSVNFAVLANKLDRFNETLRAKSQPKAKNNFLMIVLTCTHEEIIVLVTVD